MTNTQSKFILNRNMKDTVYTVTTYSHALCNPGYNQSHPGWLEGLWGIYSSQTKAENAILSQILNECGDYRVLDYDDIQRDEFGDTQYASYESHEIIRFEITHKEHGIPVIRSVVSLAQMYCYWERVEQTFEEKEDSELYYSDFECIDNNVPYSELPFNKEIAVDTENQKYATL